MAYSLRKRLSRRQAKDELRPQTSDEEASSRSPSPLSIDDTSTTTSRSAQSQIAPEDLSSTPPPPQQTTLRRVSPSSSSINRYKLRAPAAVAPSVSPAKPVVDHKTGRTTAFSEMFDNGVSPITTPPATYPTTPSRELRDPILVKGADFELMTAPRSGEMMNKSTSVEVVPAIEAMTSLSITDVPAPRKRLTRSHSRRESRADSGATDLQQAAADPKDSKSLVPAGLTVRKLSDIEIPWTTSPNKQKQLPPLVTSATPANSPYGSQNAPLISFCKNGTSTTDDYPSPDAISPDPLIISPGTIPESPTPAATTATEFRDFATAPGSVMVRPPLYDPTKLPLHQWCSVYGADSRPEIPWGWMKKWTCCHCHAQTMVEQRDCARLDCGHGRCLRSCKVIRGGMAVHNEMS